MIATHHLLHAPRRVTQITSFIRSSSPKTKIVLLGVLPRGAQYWIWEQAFLWPNRYQKAIAAVNAGYYVRCRLYMIHLMRIPLLHCGAAGIANAGAGAFQLS